MHLSQLDRRIVVLMRDDGHRVLRFYRLRFLRLNVKTTDRAQVQGLAMRCTVDYDEVVQVNQQWGAIVGHADCHTVFNAYIGIVVWK